MALKGRLGLLVSLELRVRQGCLVRSVLLAGLVREEDRGGMERMGWMESQDRRGHQEEEAKLVRMAFLAFKASLERRVLPVIKARQVCQDIKDRQERSETQVCLDLKVLEEDQVLQVLMGPLESLDLEEAEAPLESKEILACLGR